MLRFIKQRDLLVSLKFIKKLSKFARCIDIALLHLLIYIINIEPVNLDYFIATEPPTSQSSAAKALFQLQKTTN